MTLARYDIDDSSAHYPTNLRRVYGELALPRLRAIGNIELLDRPAVGFCGSRRASERGLAIAGELAAALAARGIVVTSGYAKGVDTRAHSSALIAGGSTIVSLPEGLNNFRIKRELAEHWSSDRTLVISQYPDDAVWRADRAMERNKVIVAISAITIVIEAGATGGTLDAGMTALKQGMPLFVVSYSDENELNEGNRILLASGATRLGRNPQTGRPNVEKILARISGSERHGIART